MSDTRLAEPVGETSPLAPPRRSRWTLSLILLAAVSVLMAFSVILLATPIADVRGIKVEGASGPAATTIAAAADVSLAGPLARVDVTAVGERITAAIPAVERVQVSRSWPHSVGVTVIMRVPVARYPGDGTLASAVIDKRGVQHLPLGDVPRGLPILTLAGPAARGDDRELTVKAAASVAAALPSVLRSQVRGLEGRTPDDLRLQLRNGVVVRWGDASRSERKVAVLMPLLAQRASVYDVSAPDSPTTAGSKKRPS